MKIRFTLLFYSMVLSVTAEDQIRMVRHGTNVTEEASAFLTTNVVKMLRSCCYPSSTAYAVKADTWQNLERSDSYVLLLFAPPKKLKVVKAGDDDIRKLTKDTVLSEVIPIDQILLPLPEDGFPRHIFVKSGTNVLSFCKWDPIALGKVASEPALHMSRGYTSLADLEHPNK
jgi:hypothetical protein